MGFSLKIVKFRFHNGMKSRKIIRLRRIKSNTEKGLRKTKNKQKKCTDLFEISRKSTDCNDYLFNSFNSHEIQTSGTMNSLSIKQHIKQLGTIVVERRKRNGKWLFLAIFNKLQHLYFSCANKNYRAQYDKKSNEKKRRISWQSWMFVFFILLCLCRVILVLT